MDVLSFLNFWRNAGVGDPIFPSFFQQYYHYYYSNSSKHNNTLFSNNIISPLADSSNTKTAFGVIMRGFQNTKTKSDKNKLKRTTSDNHQLPSKRFSKEAVNKYINMMKPLYNIKVSRTSNDKRLGKSRSSSAVKVTPSPAATSYDSEDGIQSAILHCKKSYTSLSPECNVLSRSGSAPSQGTRISIEEGKRCSI